MVTATALRVPFVDLGRQHAEIGVELSDAFQRVVRRGGFTLGGEVDAFESEFAHFTGTREAVGVGSGTDALHFALRACGVGAGDEVITTASTFAATAEAIVSAGGRPVFVDIDPDTSLMDLRKVEEAITPATRAVIPVHLYGQCVDMRRLGEIARAHGLKVVEDACQAHGAKRNGVAAGAGGDAGCFSFYPSKNLGALGDGGMVTTNDPAIAARVRALRSHGEDDTRTHREVGYCSRLHGMQAAMLRVKLPWLPEWNADRRETGRVYDDAFRDTGVRTLSVAPGATHVRHLYVVRVDDRERVRARLRAAGVDTAVHYPLPLHLEPAFAYLGYKPGDFPEAERAASEILSLPMYPYLSAEEVGHVASSAIEAIDA